MTTTFRGSICTLAAALTMTVALHGQTLNTIFNFEHGETGHHPTGGVTIDPDGSVYGITESGGAADFGVAYKLAAPASPDGAWTEHVLHSFTESDGPPTAGLLLGPSGQLYGVALGPDGGGTAFRLKPPGGASPRWRETVLHAFTGENGDGADPESVPIFGPRGVLYGSTKNGGSSGDGTIYSLAPPDAQGGAWTEHILYNFPGYGLADPAGQMALGSDGTIYGATYGIFQLAPPTVRGGSWTESVVYSFVAPGDSGFPNGVVLGPGGALYGTAFGGSGKGCDSGCGSVFQLTPPVEQGGAWTETILHSFAGAGTADGNQP